MSADIQPTFQVEYVEKRSRLTTFFRLFMIIPHLIVYWLYSIAAFFTIIAAWFAVVITGKYPEGLYRFNANLARFGANLNGYASLLTDDFPPFALSGDEVDNYAVQLKIGPPKDKYSRALAFFRIIVGIPVIVISYGMALIWEIGAFCAWFAILVTGKQPKGLQEFTELGLGYSSRASAYFLLLTEKWPTLSNPDSDTLPPAPPAAPLEPVPAAPAPAATTDFAPPAVPVQPPPPSAPQPNPFGD